MNNYFIIDCNNVTPGGSDHPSHMSPSITTIIITTTEGQYHIDHIPATYFLWPEVRIVPISMCVGNTWSKLSELFGKVVGALVVSLERLHH